MYPDTFAFVQFHMFDEHSLPWGDARWGFYAGEYTPLAVFNGVDEVVGAVSDIDQQYNIYRLNHFLPRRALPTDVSVELTVEQISGPTYRATVVVGIDANGVGKTLRVYTVQVVDHWPESVAYHRNGFKQAAPTTDITLAPGGSQSVVNDLTFDAESMNHDKDIKIIVWAQDPVAAGPGEVYQAAIRAWPLVSGPNDWDGDGILDGTDNCPHRYNIEQADGDGDLVGDLCDNCETVVNTDQTDTDEDGYGDACDNCDALHYYLQDDADGDGFGNVCDSCPEVPAPGGVDAFGRSLGTIDIDCDVDRFDVDLFAKCVGGPGITTAPLGCEAGRFDRADVDSDGDVDMDDLPIFALNLTGPLVSPALYIGAAACMDCHTSNHTSWLGTIHATAFDTLIADGAGENTLCFPCHTVGYGQASGFVDLATTPDLADVQCENCHGPGSNHAADPPDVPLPKDYDADLCGQCHQSCHGLCGENHHPQFEQWSESGHSRALFDVWMDPDSEDSCLQCHSTDYRLAAPGEEPSLFEAMFSVECVACHQPHGSAYKGQLRVAPQALCADCHTMGNVVPDGTPERPQAEMLHGYGGFELDGDPMEGPFTEHWWGIPKECVICHVHEEEYGGPQQPVNSGHLFVANMRACEPCHTEQAATVLVASAREEIEARLAEIGHYVTPGDPLYVDPATLTPEVLAEYEVAVFNYEFVAADKSDGSHNAFYARALLAETEAFFGITPWLRGFGETEPDSSHDEASPTEGGRGLEERHR